MYSEHNLISRVIIYSLDVPFFLFGTCLLFHVPVIKVETELISSLRVTETLSIRMKKKFKSRYFTPSLAFSSS